MTTNGLTIVSVTDLMRETGKAHSLAHKNTDGEDLDWSLWYSEYLTKPLGGLFDREFTQSQLNYCLVNAENERVVTQPDSDWPRFYAEYFYERYSGTDTPKEDELALYILPGCPFCVLVRNTISKLGINVELRDIASDPDHHRDLVNERKRATVPVLRIISPGGFSRWMPESRDIVQYLEKAYG